uniref:ATP synthase F0 subunit 8 n=1 Tax=Lasioglossum malachurum TaxID=88512 RepID=A0A0S2LTX8_9HYME|nr:ATP synthase F0 subunit 8 [Lasioglossum malachurum]
MYWTFLLIYTMLNMYMFMSLLYFSPSLSFNKFKIVKKYPKMNKKLIF